MPELEIVRGLPGSRKSTEARKEAAVSGRVVLEPDTYHIQNGVYMYDPKRHVQAVRDLVSYAKNLISNFGCDVVLVDVFPNFKLIGDLPQFAAEHGYSVRVITRRISVERSLRCNIHNALEADIRRMAAEWEPVAGEEIVEVPED